MGEAVGSLRGTRFSSRSRWWRRYRIVAWATTIALILSISASLLHAGSLCRVHSLSSSRVLQLCSSADGTGTDDAIADADDGHGHGHGSGLSIYLIHNEFGVRQYAYAFRNLCYNGSHMVSSGRELQCVEPDGSLDARIVTGVACSSQQLAFRALASQVPAESEFSNFSFSAGAWAWRRPEARWIPGTSAALHLGPATTNVAHFLARANVLHLLNNATLPALPQPVHRFFLLRHRMHTRLLDKKVDAIHGFHGSHGFMAVVLADLLASALGAEPTPRDLVGAASAAGGLVHLDRAFWNATDQRPLCFRSLLLFSLLKGAYWPGGPPVADIVRARLKKKLLGLEEEQPVITGGWPEVPVAAAGPRPLKLLYVFRKNTRRVFSSASEAAFRDFLASLPGYSLRVVDFKPLQFREQFAAVQEADVVISLHGANLVNPTTFGKRKSVVVEVIPFKVVHRMYETQAVNTGVPYMAVRCSQGPVQDGDDSFRGLDGEHCMANASCKQYFVHTRHIDLTDGEFSHLRRVLRVAHLLVSGMDEQGRWSQSAIPALGHCKTFSKGYDPANPSPWLSYRSAAAGDSATLCFIQSSREEEASSDWNLGGG